LQGGDAAYLAQEPKIELSNGHHAEILVFDLAQ